MVRVRVQSFVAINEPQEGGSSEQETQEAREAKLIGLYELALRSLARKEAAEAEAAFRQVLADPLVQGGASPQLQRVRFLSLKNLGGLLATAGVGGGGDAREALECYVSACELEAGDVVLWNRLGTLASESGFWALARHAFERGLACSPQHPTMRAKLQLLLRHVGAAAEAPAPAPPRVPSSSTGLGQPLPGNTGGLLRLPPLSYVRDSPLPVAAAPQPQLPQAVQLSEPSWAAMLSSMLAAASPSGPMPSALRFTLPAEKKAAARGQGAGKHAAGGAKPGGAAHQGAAAEPQQEVVRLQLTPTKASRAASGAGAGGGGTPTAAPGTAAAGTLAASTAAAAPAAATAAEEVDEGEHVVVELVVQPRPTALQTAEAGQSPAPLQALQATPQPLGAPGEGSPTDVAGATPASAAPQTAGPAAPAAQGTRGQRRRKSAGRRGQPEPQEPGTPHAPSQTAVLSLVELMGALGSKRQQLPSQTEQTPAAGGGLEAQAVGAAGGGTEGAAGTLCAPSPPGQQAAAGSAAEAVRSFVAQLPREGLAPSGVLLALVERLAGSPEAAATLLPGERTLLLRAAERVQQEVEAGSLLPRACCLVLAELCISAAASDSTPSAAPAAFGEGGKASKAPSGRQLAAAAAGKGLGRGRGKAGGGADGPQPLPPAQLRRHAEQWLLRCMSASVAAQLAGGSNSAAPGLASAANAAANGAEGSAVQGPETPPPPPPPAAGPGAEAVRYWWARAQLQEARGAASEAAQLYQRCLQALEDWGLPAVPLPHYVLPAPAAPAAAAPAPAAVPAPAPTPAPPPSINATAILGKLELLKLHDMVAEAEILVEQGRHEAAADGLAPYLLSCNSKEESMAAMGQWHQALGTLRGAALACGHPWLAAACQLRLVWHALAALPGGVEVAGAGPEGHTKEASKALAQAVRSALAPAAAAALTSALESSAHFLAARRSQLESFEGSTPGDRRWREWEWRLLRRVQRRLLGVVEGCRVALAGSESKGSGHLSLQTSSLHRTMAAAAELAVQVWALDPAAQHGPAATAALLHGLCEALAQAQALMEREGAFVQLCLGELRAAMEGLRAQHGEEISDAEEGEEGEPSPGDLYWELKRGLHSCLRWLYGLELPGWQDDPWAEEYQARPLAERLLSSRVACLSVWPLVSPHFEFLLDDREAREAEQLARFKELQKSEGFIHLVAAQFASPPPSALRRLEGAWARLEAGEPPADLLAGTVENPLEGPWEAPAAGALAEIVTGGEGPQAMAVDSEAPAGPAGAAVEAAADAQQAQQGRQQQQQQQRPGEPEEEAEEEGEAYAALRGSLYRILAALQPDLQDAVVGGDILGPSAEGDVERMLAPFRHDLLYAPRRFWTWEQLAVSYHEAADWVLEEAVTNISPQEWASEAQAPLRQRYRRYRHLGYQCTALALRYAESPHRKAQLLAGTGHRIYNDLQRVPPFCDPLLPRLSTAQASSEQQQQQQHLRQQACLRAMRAFSQTTELHPDDWECVLQAARCQRKLQLPPRDWLPRMAAACHLAAAHAGGALGAVYALHAARLKLVLGMRSVHSGAAEHGAAQQELWEGLQLVGRYCFLRATQQALAACGWLPRSVVGEPASQKGSDEEEATAAATLVPACGAAVDEEAAMADAEAAEGSRALVPGASGSGSGGGGAAVSVEEALRLLLHDCSEALRWCQQKDKIFHRATYRLAEARLVTEGRAAALEELAALFSKPPKQPFCINPTQITAGEAADAPAGGRKQKKGRKGAQQRVQTPRAERGATPEHDYGLCAGRVSGVGQEESLQQYYGAVRKYLRRYLQLLGEEGWLETLRAAAVPAFSDVRQLAAGQVVLCLLRSMHSACPPARLLPHLVALVGPGTEQDAPQAPAGAALSPAEQAQQRLQAELSTLAKQLEGQPAVEATLDPLYQFWVEHSLLPKEDGLGWDQGVQAPVQLALQAGGSLLGPPEELERSEALFRVYAELHVLLLGRRKSWERLLVLIKGLKARQKGTQQPGEAVQRHLELLAHESFAALQHAGEGLCQEAAALRPELAAPPQANAAPQPPPPQQQRAAAPAPAPALAPQPKPQQAQQAGPQAFLPLSEQGCAAVVDRLPPPDRQAYAGFLAALAQRDPAQAQRYSLLPAMGVAQATREGKVSLAASQLAAAAHAMVQTQSWGLAPQMQPQLAAAAAPQRGPASPPPLTTQAVAQQQALVALAAQQAQAQVQVVQQAQQAQAFLVQVLQLLSPQERQAFQQFWASASLHPDLGPALLSKCSLDPNYALEVAIASGVIPQATAMRVATQLAGQLAPAAAPAGGPSQAVLSAPTLGPLSAAGRGPMPPVVAFGLMPGLLQAGLLAGAAPPATLAVQPAAAAGALSPTAPVQPPQASVQPAAAAVAAPAPPAPASAPGPNPTQPQDTPAKASQQVQQPAAAPSPAIAAATPPPPGGSQAGLEAPRAEAEPAAAGTGPLGDQPPALEPLTPEEMELLDRVVAVLRGLRELQKVVHAAGQGAGWKSDTTGGLHALLKHTEQLLARVYRAYAALNRSPGPPAGKVALHKACDETVKRHRRLSHQRGSVPLGAPGESGAAEGDGPAGSQQQQQAAGEAGGRKRGRPPRAVSRELSAAASDQQESSAAGGGGGVPGSARKRARREASGSAPPSPKQPAPASKGSAPAPPPVAGAADAALEPQGAPAGAGPSVAMAPAMAVPPAEPAQAAAVAGAKRGAPEEPVREGEGDVPGPPAKRLCSGPATHHLVASAAHSGPAGLAREEAGVQAAAEQPQQAALAEGKNVEGGTPAAAGRIPVIRAPLQQVSRGAPPSAAQRMLMFAKPGA